MNSSKKYKILVVGCGELGSRHLQAVASLPNISEVEVVDPSAKGLEVGQRRLEDVAERNADTKYKWLTDINKASTGGDLCLITTQSGARLNLFETVVNRLGYQQFLLEKIVTQSSKDYETMVRLADQKSAKVWVNCKTRAYPVHQYIKSQLNPEEPVLFQVAGGNHGLANNGVHASDLFIFYDGSSELNFKGMTIDPILHPSKRGSELFDLSGTLLGSTPKGGQFMLSYVKDHVGSEQITITTKSRRYFVDHTLRMALEREGDNGTWKPISYEGKVDVSEMSKAFVSDILTKQSCQLPSLKDCQPAHRFILDALQPEFGRLLGREMNHCPVT